MKYFIILALIFSHFCFANDVTPNIGIGAKVFNDRCVLCHGSSAMGEGILPLKIKNYPDTNLIISLETLNREQIKSAVIYGGTEGRISQYMPPMGNDLTWTQTESVVDFVMLLKTNKEKAFDMLTKLTDEDESSYQVGQQLFQSRCALCHGKYGEGDGRMAKVIKSPPPANLTISRLPDDYLEKIIIDGGEGVGRSGQMPPWGMQFSKSEIQSIIQYVKKIRR